MEQASVTVPAHGGSDPSDGQAPAERGSGNRRALLLGGAAAAAAVLARTRTAGAADGGNVVIGQANTATSGTSLTASSGTYAFTAQATTSYGFGLRGVGTAYGVYGIGTNYAGVFGDTSGPGSAGTVGLSRSASGSGAGVSGGSNSPEGFGVAGYSPGIGVFGRADDASPDPEGPVGVAGRAGQGGGVGGWFLGGRAAIHLVPSATTGAPAVGAHEVGDVVVDSAGRVFACTTAGTPGVWNELGAPPPAAPTPRPTLQLLPVPERFIDTRDGTGGLAGTAAARTTRTFSLTGRPGLSKDPARQVPDSAIYAVGNLAVIGADGIPAGSFMTLWASGPRPETASINFGPASSLGVVANSVLVNLADIGDGHRGFQLYNNAACDYVFDVTGYYVMA